MLIDDEIAAGILEPINGGVGIDARESEDDDLVSRFRELRSQRKAIFREEQRLAMGGDAAESDIWSWEDLAEHAVAFLTSDAKDLEPMAMVIEAAVRTEGLPGLDRSMNLMADLVEKFWADGLYPPEDEDDGVEARFQPLSGLSGGTNDKDGTLIQPLRRMVLAVGTGGEIDFVQRIAAETQFANAQRSDTDSRAANIQEAEAAFAALDANALSVPVSKLKIAVAHLESAEKGWRRGIDFIITQTKPLMPAASRVTEELRKMREWMAATLRKLPDSEPGPSDDGGLLVVVEGEGGVATVARVDGPLQIGRINSREDALRAIGAAAEYFERLEPHSPFGVTLKEVDRRAKMSLNELLEELIPDAGNRREYYWRSGIKPPADSG